MRCALRPWDDELAWRVFQALDGNDLVEAGLARGVRVSAPGLFADWRSLNPLRVESSVAVIDRVGAAVPFAVLGVNQTAATGVCEAALLACDHARFRRPLAQLGGLITVGLSRWALTRGIYRIEARSWSGHPTAGAFLQHCGFRREAVLAGFGPAGSTTFEQFAWTAT